MSSSSTEGETVWDKLEKEESIPNLVACIEELKRLVETYEQTKRECCTDHEARLKVLEGK